MTTVFGCVAEAAKRASSRNACKWRTAHAARNHISRRPAISDAPPSASTDARVRCAGGLTDGERLRARLSALSIRARFGAAPTGAPGSRPRRRGRAPDAAQSAAARRRWAGTSPLSIGSVNPAQLLRGCGASGTQSLRACATPYRRKPCSGSPEFRKMNLSSFPCRRA